MKPIHQAYHHSNAAQSYYLFDYELDAKHSTIYLLFRVIVIFGAIAFLGCGSAIAFWDVRVRSFFEGVGGAIAFGDVGVAIVFFGVCGRSFFGGVEVRSLLFMI